MDGERFVNHLKILGVPGAESLVGSDYDWVFLTEDNSLLTTFLEWFTGNVVPGDVLTEEELNEYDAAVSRGEILTSHQLEEMEACFSGLPTSYNSSQEEGQSSELSSEEQERLESQLTVLTARKNQLSMHKMELREEIYCAMESTETAEASYRSQQERLSSTSRHLSEATSGVASSLDKLSDIFISFDETPEEDLKFLSQLDFDEWRQEEAKFTSLLKAYITKQFREGVNKVAGINDSTEYCLLDMDNLDLHLVRGAGKLQYMENVKELNRLDELLLQTEGKRLEGLILQARRQAEVEEATRLLAAVHRGHQLPTALPLIQQQMTEATESQMLVKHEREQKHQILQSLVAEVAQLESTKTISGNYQMKCKRQEYFLEKQKIVMDQLTSQLARHDWIKIALDIEGEKISDFLQVLKSICSILSDEDDNYKERLKRMEKFKQEHDREKAIGILPPALVTLSQILPSFSQSHLGCESQQEEPVNGDVLLKQAKALQKASMTAREQILTASNPQFSRLSRMATTCELLESGLFGNAGSLRTLPFTWLDPELVEQYSNLDQEHWKLKQKILELLGQYEEKKKALQVEPALHKELTQWTKDIMKSL